MSEPRSKLIGGQRFFEGEILSIKGVGFVCVAITKRGIALRRVKSQPKEVRQSTTETL